MPPIGLGTWQLTGDTCREAVTTALTIGYRHIDTAQIYRNEGDASFQDVSAHAELATPTIPFLGWAGGWFVCRNNTRGRVALGCSSTTSARGVPVLGL